SEHRERQRYRLADEHTLAAGERFRRPVAPALVVDDADLAALELALTVRREPRRLDADRPAGTDAGPQQVVHERRQLGPGGVDLERLQAVAAEGGCEQLPVRQVVERSASLLVELRQTLR